MSLRGLCDEQRAAKVVNAVLPLLPLSAIVRQARQPRVGSTPSRSSEKAPPHSQVAVSTAHGLTGLRASSFATCQTLLITCGVIGNMPGKPIDVFTCKMQHLQSALLKIGHLNTDAKHCIIHRDDAMSIPLRIFVWLS